MMRYMNVSGENTHAGAHHFVLTARRLGDLGHRPRILVAGCGEGHEAKYIHEQLGGELDGIDVDHTWPPGFGGHLDASFRLRKASVLELPFADGTFDAVFYHHVIEHVDDPAASLRELARVLRAGGLMYAGCPNRHRVIGYVGSFGVSWKEKLNWNIVDWSSRLRGRFRNELGAHAGFTERELMTFLQQDFHDATSLTADYLKYKYGSKLPSRVLASLERPLLRNFLAPSVYAVAWR
jgi:SAM-dependent methyltransferase